VRNEPSRCSLLHVLISGLHAARVAARLRRELRIDVDMVRSRYGEFKVLVDGGQSSMRERLLRSA
jgi:hypothetical protein